jgi:hypothetical protein
MIRNFYKKKQHSAFENLIMNHVSSRDYTACSARVNALMDDYNRFDIERIKDTHLFNVLTELIKYDVKNHKSSVQYISQAHHHYINGNMRNYRACVYMFFICIIEGADDRSLVALRIRTRIEYSQYMFPTSDPIVPVVVRRIEIIDLLTGRSMDVPPGLDAGQPIDLDALDALDVPITPSRIRHRSSNGSHEEPPRQRRRIDQLPNSSDGPDSPDSSNSSNSPNDSLF